MEHTPGGCGTERVDLACRGRRAGALRGGSASGGHRHQQEQESPYGMKPGWVMHPGGTSGSRGKHSLRGYGMASCKR